MATVYLARDLKHDRQVALKILKPDLAALLGAERFILEIRTTAALQHPHILPLFDSGEADGFLYYVMPFVDGETLRSRLDRETQLGVEDAVRIARDLADALHYAHTHGVIHRDIKPENVLLHDGRPLIADFGIALAIREAGGTRLTSTGLSVGTPSYMSPEQAMGDHRIDARSDIYSLGTMLYEMLAGAPPFTGSTVQAIVARILTESPPPITRARSSVPAHVAAAIHTALERLPADRFASAAAFGTALANLSYTVPGFVGAARATAGRPHAPWSPRSVAIAGVALVATLAAAWFASRPTPEIPVRRLSLFLPAAEQLGQVAFSRLALAPDGSAFAYTGQDATGTPRLMLRFFGEFGAVSLPGTEAGVSPSFSPDGTRIAFLSRAPFTIKVVAVNGAPATTLEDQNVLGGGVAWSADDWIYFDTGNSLDRIRADGEQRETVVALDSTVEEVGFAWPEPLPNGRGLIYRSRRAGESIQSYVLRVVDLRTRETRTLVQGLLGRYSPTGHLLYVRADGVLVAAPFDQDRMELTGPPTALIEGLDIVGFGAADVVLSPSGDLLFVRSSAGGGARLSWVQRDGSAALVDPAWGAGSESISEWALSPDGRRLAVAFRGTSRQGSPGDIWVKDLDDGPLSRLTFEGINGAPAWTADGRAIIYRSARSTDPNIVNRLFRISADGSGSPEPLLSDPRGVDFVAVSRRDGWIVAATSDVRAGGGDLLAFRPGQHSQMLPLLESPAYEGMPALSPDGRWLAYASNESGQLEIYIRPFPEIDRGKWQVSEDGGSWPQWSHSGNELFYASSDGGFMTAEIRISPALSIGRRLRLHPSGPVPRFEVGLDDQRFLRLWFGATPDSTSTELMLIQNFLSTLRERE